MVRLYLRKGGLFDINFLTSMYSIRNARKYKMRYIQFPVNLIYEFLDIILQK